MGFIWYWLVAMMIAAYVVFDGFDLGVGILYPILGRSEKDRGTMIQSIGPVWDGNEVWLIAGGGTLFFAFPLLYASAFSGFYLPLMIVLWLLMLRALGVELRGHVESEVWSSFFGGLFFLGSALLAIFFGAALGNVLRGVPIGSDQFFFLPLWTDWVVGPHPGVLDWYTVLSGLVALVALTTHGAYWIWHKTSGDLSERARRVAGYGWLGVCLLTIASLLSTIGIRPVLLRNYENLPILYIIPFVVLVSICSMEYFRRKGNALRAFLSSCSYLAFMLVGAGAGLYPVLLPSSLGSQGDLTIANTRAGSYALHIGLIWWGCGILMAIGYFITVYWLFRGKAEGTYHV